MAVLDGFLYAVGGQDGVQCLNHVERYDPKENKWAKVSGSGGGGYCELEMMCDDNIFVFF